MEFSGTYYKCTKCKHVWAYDDDACPECGCKEITDVYPIHNNDVEVGMRVSTKNGVKGYIHEFPDLHNVLIAFDGTGISFERFERRKYRMWRVWLFLFLYRLPRKRSRR
jgi:hypothetical protein